MMKVILASVLVVVVGLAAACGEDELGSGNGQCARRDNIGYIAKYTVRSGNCGPGTERISRPAPQPTEIDAPCTGSIRYTGDNCEVAYDSECPEDGIVKGGKLRIVGQSKWDTEAKRATAVEQWTAIDANGQTICNGTYDVSVTRQ
jgi:hypothetical protein